MTMSYTVVDSIARNNGKLDGNSNTSNLHLPTYLPSNATESDHAPRLQSSRFGQARHAWLTCMSRPSCVYAHNLHVSHVSKSTIFQDSSMTLPSTHIGRTKINYEVATHELLLIQAPFDNDNCARLTLVPCWCTT
jgi:hypothetical protein